MSALAAQLPLDPAAEDADRIFREAARAYIAERRAAVAPFIDSHFRMRGALRVHRAALGADMLRAPTNIALAVPHFAARVCEGLARRCGAARTAAWLERREIFLETAVEREVSWLIHTELLGLPYRQKGRVSERDALAEALVAHPEVQAAIETTLAAVGPRIGDPSFRHRLDQNLRRYASGRAAAAEIATALASSGLGAAAFHQVTPSALSLGPMLAAALAQQAAIASFPLGAGLGAVWYGVFPAAPTAALVGGVTAGLVASLAVLAAFAGVVTDPIERALGIHRRRLNALIDALEVDLLGTGRSRFNVRSHYVARLLDMFECLRIAYRVAH